MIIRYRSLALPHNGIGVEIKLPHVRFSAAAFGRPHDWSLTPLQNPGDGEKTENKALVERIAQAVRSVGGHTVLATRPVEANAQIIEHYALNRHIALGDGVVLRRNGSTPADGTPLPKGHVSAMSAGGCPRIVLVRGTSLVDAHAARDSLVDRAKLNGKKGREHESVVDAMLSRLHVRSHREAQGVYAFVFFSINPQRFVHSLEHPVHGLFNRILEAHITQNWARCGGREVVEKRGNEMCIDLPKLIRAQLIKRGVEYGNIDLKYAYAPDSLLYDTRADASERLCRNLVLIARHD